MYSRHLGASVHVWQKIMSPALGFLKVAGGSGVGGGAIMCGTPFSGAASVLVKGPQYP